MSQNGLGSSLPLLFGEKKNPIPSTRSSNISHSEASTDSFDLVESPLVTEEDALAAQEGSERLRIQAEARLALQVRAVDPSTQPLDRRTQMAELQDCITKLSLKSDPATSALPTGASCPGVEADTTMADAPAMEASTPKPEGTAQTVEGKSRPHTDRNERGQDHAPGGGHPIGPGAQTPDRAKRWRAGSKGVPLGTPRWRRRFAWSRTPDVKFQIFPDSFPSIPHSIAKLLRGTWPNSGAASTI